MRKSYLIAASAALLLALGGMAEAKGPSAGAVGGSNSPPPGFGSPGGHNGLDTAGSTPEPNGWDQGKAWWKDTTDTTDTKDPLPPGISGTKK